MTKLRLVVLVFSKYLKNLERTIKFYLKYQVSVFSTRNFKIKNMGWHSLMFTVWLPIVCDTQLRYTNTSKYVFKIKAIKENYSRIETFIS